MYFQEYRIHLVNGQVIQAAEEVSIPSYQRLTARFKASKPDDVLTVGDDDTGKAYIPVRNILYISAGDRIRW